MTTRAPIHLRPTTELAERVLLPGDPGRALALAQTLLEKPLMFNHHRGLWGYTGEAADGEPLTIQSTGMGGPSAAIVLHELIALGVRRAIRVGTCGALDGELALGDLVVAREALAADGTSRALGADGRVAADEELTAALSRASCGTAATTVVSTDLFYEHDSEREHAWRAAGAVAVEMEAATLFAIGARLGIPVACALTVSDVIAVGARAGDGGHAWAGDEPMAADHGPAPTGQERTAAGDGHAQDGAGRVRIDDDALLAAAQAMGRVALSALAV